jgi:hypothetical protein
MLLLAFVKHGTCVEGYMMVMDSLTQTRTKTQNMRWLSWKETTDKYGDAEAKSRVQQGSLPVRKDPRDARFFQFLVVEDSSQLTLAQQRELQAARETKLPSADFKQLSGCIRMDMDDDIMEDVWDEKFEGVMALKDLKDKVQEDVSEDADDDEDGLPKDLRYQLGLGGASKDKTKGKADKPDKKNNFDDKVDMMSQVGDGNSAVALRKCNVMHALLSKQTLKIRQLEASLLQKVLAKNEHAAVAKQLEQTKKGLDKSVAALDKAVVEKKGTLESQKLLLASTFYGKAAQKLIELLQNLDKAGNRGAKPRHGRKA